MNMSEYPMDAEAYKEYVTPVRGTSLRRFLNMDFFARIADALGRQITIGERRKLIDFERDNDNSDSISTIKCFACGAGSAAVWWTVPNIEFNDHLKKHHNLDLALAEIRLPKFGCFLLNPNNKLDPPVALCGAAFPGFVGNEKRYHKSCLRDFHEQSNKFGLPFASILKIQQDIRDEARRKAEADAAEQRRVQQLRQAKLEEERRQQEQRDLAEKERKGRINKLALVYS